MRVLVDLVGKRFGRWTVLHRRGSIGTQPLWCCRCICGNIGIVRGWNLRHGISKSCGCLKGEKHGETKHIKEYRCWLAMKDRCYRLKAPKYKNYGGRGIHICKGFHSYITFLSLIGRAPSSDHSIDRIDNNKGYNCGRCKECRKSDWMLNVKWSTAIQQRSNRRDSNQMRLK